MVLVKGIEGKAWNMRRAARVVYSVRVYGEVLLHQKGERRAWDRTRRAGGGHGYEDELTSVGLRRAATHVAAALRVGVGRDGRRAADERRTGVREKDGEGGGGGRGQTTNAFTECTGGPIQ